jgi:hypothetical protein
MRRSPRGLLGGEHVPTHEQGRHGQFHWPDGAHDCALLDDRDAIAHGKQLVMVGADEDDRFAGAG